MGAAVVEEVVSAEAPDKGIAVGKPIPRDRAPVELASIRASWRGPVLLFAVGVVEAAARAAAVDRAASIGSVTVVVAVAVAVIGTDEDCPVAVTSDEAGSVEKHANAAVSRRG